MYIERIIQGFERKDNEVENKNERKGNDERRVLHVYKKSNIQDNELGHTSWEEWDQSQ